MRNCLGLIMIAVSGCATAAPKEGPPPANFAGTTRASVDSEGHCSITQSSGYKEIDRKTCDVLKAKMKECEAKTPNVANEVARCMNSFPPKSRAATSNNGLRQ